MGVERKEIRMYREVNKKKENMRLIVIVVSLLLFIAIFALTTKNKDNNYISDIVIVERGDTLWGIADKYCPEYMDKRQYIEHIQTDSGCNTDIYPGDVLVVRVYE